MIKICFTGHRPDADGMGGYDFGNSIDIELMDVTYKILETMYNKYRNPNSDKHYLYTIVGGAVGYDEIALNACKELKGVIDIEIELAAPFKKWKGNWPKETINRYKVYEQYMDKITYVDSLEKYKYGGAPIGEYHPAKMQLRNKYMVDNADIVIACWNGSTKGGTFNCVNYAKKMQKRLVVINPITHKIEYFFDKKY